MLKKTPHKKIDCKHGVQHHIAQAILVSVSVISFWRGVWGLMDMYLFPNNLLFSYVISMGAGLVILYATHYIVKELM